VKVGDIVTQNGNLIQFDSQIKLSNCVGVVLNIKTREGTLPEKYSKWESWLGDSITVLWSNGKVSKSVAENALEVISETGS